MKVQVNGAAQEFEDVDELSVVELLERLAVGTRGVAVAKNLSLVPRSRWGAEFVQDGDQVEIVRATQGG